MREYELVSMAQIELQSIQWLWYKRIPLGKISLLVGNPGVGKGLLAAFIAAQASRGAEWPDQPGLREGYIDEQTGEHVGDGVIILTTEDDFSDTIVARLESAGANLTNIHTLNVKNTYKDKESKEPVYDLTQQLDLLEQAIEDKGNIRLVILDPITGYMGSLNPNSNTEVRSFMNPLKELAEKYELAILGISHLNKNAEMEAAYRTLGSMGFTAASRAVWLVLENPADPENSRLVLPVKLNVGKKPKGLEFRIEEVIVDGLNGPIYSARCEFERDQVLRTADEVFAAEKKQKRAPVKHGVKRWLENELKNGPVNAKVIESKAVREGISIGTLRRAKEEAGVKSRKSSKQEGKKWVWQLPAKKSK